MARLGLFAVGALDDAAALHHHRGGAGAQLHAVVLDGHDLADQPARGHHLVALGQRGHQALVLLELAPLGHDQDEVEDRQDGEGEDQRGQGVVPGRLAQQQRGGVHLCSVLDSRGK
jgi:hypothetical protein